MAEQPLDELPRERFREKTSGNVFEAVRVSGWIVWDAVGPQVIDPSEFEENFERVEAAPTSSN